MEEVRLGRKRLSKSGRALSVYLTDELFEVLYRKVEETGMTASEIIREVLKAVFSREIEELKKEQAEIERLKRKLKESLREHTEEVGIDV